MEYVKNIRYGFKRGIIMRSLIVFLVSFVVIAAVLSAGCVGSNKNTPNNGDEVTPSIFNQSSTTTQENNNVNIIDNKTPESNVDENISSSIDEIGINTSLF